MMASARIESHEVMDVGRLIAIIMVMLVMIIDSRGAIIGARDGLALCLKVIIPSLFPMMFLSRLLISQHFRGIRWLSKGFHLPGNSDPLLISGILCGFPVGAQLVSDAQNNHSLQPEDARRMVCVCSNCGPAFVFGIASQLFDRAWVPWSLWGIILLSSCLTSWLIPGRPGNCTNPSEIRTSFPEALWTSIKAISIVCGWVVIFRVIMTLLERWCLSRLPVIYRIILSGLLELSNGCSGLLDMENTGLKLVLCGLFMSFGGICIVMQIIGVTKDVDLSVYFPGKAFQSGICVLITYVIQLIAFPPEEQIKLPFWGMGAILAFSGFCGYFLRKSKNSSRNFRLVGV